MKCSVVLTIYNGSKFIIPLLNSLKNQTRKIDELLILDDCSTDNTTQLIRDYIKDNSLSETWHLIINEKNLGWKLNFTTGFYKASNDVIFPCDQDDIWDLNKIEICMKLFEHNKIGLLISDYDILISDSNNEHISKTHKIKTETKNVFSQIKFSNSYYKILRPGCVMAFNKTILKYYSKVWQQDYPHDATLWQIAAIKRCLYYYKKKLILYRRHTTNSSSNLFNTKTAKLAACNRIININNLLIDSTNDLSIKKTISKCNKFCQSRICFLKSKNLVNLLKLSRYISFYGGIRHFIADIIKS